MDEWDHTDMDHLDWFEKLKILSDSIAEALQEAAKIEFPSEDQQIGEAASMYEDDPEYFAFLEGARWAISFTQSRMSKDG